VVLGGGLRHARDRTVSGPSLSFVPASRGLMWRRLFAQDRLQLSPAWLLTLAASLESNPYTGAETLPSLRLAWSASPNALLWTSLSRAVRAPARVDREVFVPAQPPFLLAGGPDFRSEVSEVLEVGWRAQPTATLSYAFTAHSTRHSRLRSLVPTPQGPQWQNGIGGRSHGLEGWARWQAAARWRLDAGFSILDQDLRVTAGAIDLAGVAGLGNSPRRQAQVRSSLELGSAWRWDVDLRHVGALPQPAVPRYTAFDTRLTRALWPRTELTLGVQNLFDPRHAEWGAATNRVDFERAAFVRLRVWN
jgi:iron complex outermembrane receptor protein